MEIEKTGVSDLSVRIKDKSIVTPTFKEVLQTICYDLGIREALDLSDLDSIFNFISRNYGLMNLSDIKEAFDLFSADKLKFADPKFGHYGQFDLTFVGKVLKSYNEHKSSIHRKPPKREYNPSEGVKMRNGEVDRRTPYSSEEGKKQFDWAKNIILTTNKLPIIAAWSHISQYMEEANLVEVNLAEKEAMMNIAEDTTKRKRDPITGVIKNIGGTLFEIRWAKQLISEYFKNELK